MAIDWKETIALNMDLIVRQNATVKSDKAVAVLFDIDDVRKGEIPSMIALVEETRMENAVPIEDPDGERMLVTLPIDFDRLMAIFDEYEETDPMAKKIRFGGSVVWIICVEGMRRQFFDVYPAHEQN